MLRPYLTLPRAIHVLCLGTFINRAGTFLLVFLTLYLAETRNRSIEFATLAMGCAGAGGLFAGVVGGHWADLFGRRRVMVGALAGGAVVLAFLPSISSGLGTAAALFAFTFIAEMYRPAASAMIADLVGPEHRAHAFALMYVSINLGFACAPVIGAWIIEAFSYRCLFWSDALTSLIYAGLILAAIPETLPARKESDGSRNPSSGLIAAARWIAGDRVFLLFVLGLITLALVFVQSFSTLPLTMRGVGLDRATFGRVIAINGVMIVLLQLPITAVAVEMPRVAALVLSALFHAIGFGLTGVSTLPWHFAMTVIIWTLGEMLQAPLVSAIVSDLAPVSLRARYMGVVSMTYALANTFGAPLGGVVLQRFGVASLWVGCAIVALIAGVLYAALGRRIQPAVRPVESGSLP